MNFDNHRIWHFLNNARESGKDFIRFYHPMSTLASQRYDELMGYLKKKGFKVVGQPAYDSIRNIGILDITGIKNAKCFKDA